MQFEFTAFPRATEGRGASRRLRRTGKAPGIVYGGAAAPQPIELDHNALIHALANEAFHSSILNMKLDGGMQKVLLRDVQMHPFKRQILHIDFQRVDESRRIHMRVPLHFRNSEISPAVKLASAIINHVVTEIEVSCLPKDLPEFVEVDLAELAVGQSIHLSALTLPEGVNAIRHGDVDPVVATAIVPRVAAEAEAGAAEGAAPAEAAAEAPKPAEKAAEKPASKKDEKK